jgi:mRNA-degrading endonuclease YafQ of YafQ-DinJ toxin-antitoxin module
MRLFEILSYNNTGFHSSDLVAILEAKKGTFTPEPAQPADKINIRKSSIFDKSMIKHQSVPQVDSRLKEFILAKTEAPYQKFGARDSHFVLSFFKGLSHAHLTSDVSVVYKMTSGTPPTLDLYGVFSHDDLGTGQPMSLRTQKSMSKRFSNQF